MLHALGPEPLPHPARPQRPEHVAVPARRQRGRSRRVPRDVPVRRQARQVGLHEREDRDPWGMRGEVLGDALRGEERGHERDRHRAPHPRGRALGVEQLEVEEGPALHHRHQRLHRPAEARPRAPGDDQRRHPSAAEERLADAREPGVLGRAPRRERRDVARAQRLEARRAGGASTTSPRLHAETRSSEQRLVVRWAHRGDTSHPQPGSPRAGSGPRFTLTVNPGRSSR